MWLLCISIQQDPYSVCEGVYEDQWNTRQPLEGGFMEPIESPPPYLPLFVSFHSIYTGLGMFTNGKYVCMINVGSIPHRHKNQDI